MRPEFELNHLKYFYFTVLEGTVSKAAERLCVQQPVVSKMLKSLEERFEQPLFKKSGRKKALTDFGQLVYRHCQSAFNEIDKLDKIRKNAPLVSGPLNFGAAEGVAGDAMASALSGLIKTYPNVHPNVYVSTAKHLVDLIAARKLEFGIFLHLPDLPEELEVIEKIPVRFHLVVSRKHKNKQTIERFIGSREIDDNSTHRFPTVEHMRKDYPNTRIITSSNHLGLHKQLVLQGYGSSILPEYSVTNELKKKFLVDVYPKEKFFFTLKIVGKKSCPLSNAALTFLSGSNFGLKK